MNKISIRNPFPILFALILTAILLILVTPGWAQIYSLTYTNGTGCPPSPLGNTPTVAANATGTPFTRSTITCNSTANTFNSTTLNVTASVVTTSYIEFTATANSGYQLNCTSLAFFRQGSNSAPNQLELRYSTDNFSTFTSVTATNTPTTGTTYTWNFTDFSTANGGTVKFRLYPYGTTRCDLGTPAASTGTFRVNNIVLSGTVTATTTNPVNLSINTGTGTEAAATAITLTATTSAAVTGGQTVDVALTGTGLTNADFSGVTFPAQITIANGATTGTLSFNVNDDVSSEGSETATFTISNPSSGIVLGSTLTQNFVITDNDAPVIATTGTLNPFCTASGTASTPQSFIVSGDFLTGNLTINPPTGYAVSIDGGSTYLTTSQTISISGGNVVGEPLTVYVRVPATASIGSPGGNIAVSGGGATTQNVAVSGIVGVPVTLSTGNISILGFNGTGTDRFAFVNWVPIPDQTTIAFTDNAWTTASGPFATNENTCIWQNNTGSTIAAGTVIVFVNGSGFDLGTLLSGTMSGLNNGAENIFAYQGPSCNPTFIYGVISGATAWVSSGTPTNSDSYLPAVLSSANIILGSNGNGQYTASRSNQSTIATYQSIVNTIGNWTTFATEINPLSSTDFSVSSSPDVNLSVSSGTATETGTPTITVTLTATAAVSGNQTVSLAVTGTGITGTDYSLSSSTITILSGQTTGSVTFQILDDSNVESTETAVLTISSPSSGIILGTSTSQNIVITDNDGATYYSQASGNANTGAIWDVVPSGTGQTIASLSGFSNARSIVVQNGHVVTLGNSGTDVLNLTVDAGGTIKSGGTSNFYFDVFGNITCNGTIGAGSANDGLSFNIENTSCVLSGSGTIDISRIRKDATTPVTSSITINANINLRFNGACIYNNADNTNFNLTIASGYSVNVMGSNGTNGEVAIDGTNGASGNERGGSITVNGDLIVSKKLFALSNNTATYPCSFTIGSSGTVRTYDLDVNINNPGFTAFAINSGGMLTVTNNLDVQGGTFNTNNGVVLTSGGSLLHGVGTPSGGGAVSGNITIKRQGASGSNYNYWSTPVAAVTVPGSSIYEYISLNGTNSYADDNNPSPDPGWSAFSGSMTAGKGYASQGGGLASFTGIPNNGNISIGITSSTEPLASTTAPSKFNLIGNPYPCGLSASSLITNNTSVIAGSLYFWYDDGSGGSGYAANDYAVRTNAGGTAANSGGPTPNGNIGAGQGFIVEAVASGNVNFDNTMRNNNNSQFFKTEEDTFMNRIWLSLSNADLYNEILIAFKSDATEERDLLYDAYKLRGNSQITFAANQGEDEFVIVAFPPITDERIIPLVTYVTTPGNYTIKNKYSEYMESIPVYLEDRLLGTYTDISFGGEYAAYMSAENSVDRFFLHFAPMVTSISELAESKIKTYPNGNELIVLLSNLTEIKGSLRIMDMAGKEVYAQQNISLANNFIAVNTATFSGGIYAVNLVTEANSYTVKTFIK